jgi:hypothetical protein
LDTVLRVFRNNAEGLQIIIFITNHQIIGKNVIGFINGTPFLLSCGMINMALFLKIILICLF